MLKINIHSLVSFSNLQKQKIQQATELIEKAVNDHEFMERVLSFEYRPVFVTGRLWWKKTTYGQPVKSFFYSYGEQACSNAQVFAKIMTGWEEDEPVNDGEIDLYLQCANSRGSSATAYGYAGDDTIVIYSWWVNSASIAELANTIFHEWLHNQTWSHDFQRTPCRDYSVPYACGDILQSIIEKKYLALINS